MVYSRSKKSIKKVELYLQQLVASDKDIDFPTEDPLKFAYKLREGINASRFFALDPDGNVNESYAAYSRLNSKYIIRIEGQIVKCELRDVVPVVKLRESMSTMSIPEVSETLGIIGAAIQHKVPELIFPDASEDTVDPLAIYNWAQHNGYFLIVAESHVTLTKNNPGELAWNP